MELVLNVYDGDEIEKTFTKNKCRLRFGTCMELLKIVSVKDVGEDESLAMMDALFDKAHDIIFQVFPEMTEDEYDRLDMGEVLTFMSNAMEYTFSQLGKATPKNAKRVR